MAQFTIITVFFIRMIIIIITRIIVMIIIRIIVRWEKEQFERKDLVQKTCSSYRGLGKERVGQLGNRAEVKLIIGEGKTAKVGHQRVVRADVVVKH